MLPWAHAAFGYLLHHVYTGWHGRRPIGVPALAVVFGTQFPDLLDKPAAWTFGLLASGRSFAHSLFTFGLIAILLYVLLGEVRRREFVAFELGYASHLVGDGLAALVAGEYVELGYLLWPLTSAPIDNEPATFTEFFVALDVTLWLVFGLCLTVVGLVVWARDGYPGVADVLLPLCTERSDDPEVDL